MRRFDLRLLVLVPLLALPGCGDDKPTPTPPPAPTALPPSLPGPAPSPSDDDPFAETDPSKPVVEEEDEEPTVAPGELSDEASAYLDEALGKELTTLEGKGAAGRQREKLDQLPDDPAQVLNELRDYKWTSPEAKRLYDKAVATS
jgi:hypothetical protein